MTRYRVRLTEEAERDLIDIYQYVAVNDSASKADHQLESRAAALADLPDRGHAPQELDSIGVMHYREVHFKPYRIIYEITGRDVMIHCIVDGRRDMKSLLERRLTR